MGDILNERTEYDIEQQGRNFEKAIEKSVAGQVYFSNPDYRVPRLTDKWTGHHNAAQDKCRIPARNWLKIAIQILNEGKLIRMRK